MRGWGVGGGVLGGVSGGFFVFGRGWGGGGGCTYLFDIVVVVYVDVDLEVDGSGNWIAVWEGCSDGDVGVCCDLGCGLDGEDKRS